MAESSLYVGERSGARVFRIGRIGFDQGSMDLGTHVYSGVYRTERFAPAGNGSLVNFRRVAIHLLSSGSYTFTVKVWVDDGQTQIPVAFLGDNANQEVEISGGPGALREVTEEVVIEAQGSHIQVEITVDSDDVTGLFLIEGIRGHGRIVRRSSSRAGETS